MNKHEPGFLFNRTDFFPLLLLWGVLLLFAMPARAGIITDGSLGEEIYLRGPAYLIKQSYGQRAGTNLFHSFSIFNLKENEAAAFAGDSWIKNIISRVTGGTSSRIDGGLFSLIPGADLYFINPAGVIFGPDARVSVKGSLYVSTADYLRMGKTGIFSANTSEPSRLSVASPSAFGFISGQPAGISKEKGFIRVSEGESVSLIGGDITLQEGRAMVNKEQEANSFILARDGEINLVSVASNGEVSAAPMETPENAFEKFGAIRISDSTPAESNIQRNTGNLHVSGEGGGKVYIRGGQILLDNADVFADTLGNKDGREIAVHATDELVLRNGAKLTAESIGKGNAGAIKVTAKHVRLQSGGQFRSSSQAAGAAGSIEVFAAGEIEISGHADTFAGRKYSSILSAARNPDRAKGAGGGGQASIQTSLLTLADGGSIRSETQGFGDAGDISVETDRLVLKNGGRIQLSALKGEYKGERFTGNAGRLSVRARESILITGKLGEKRHSGFTSNTSAAGRGGEIAVETPVLELEDGGRIQASSIGYADAGRIFLDTGRLHIKKDSGIHADSGAWGEGRGGEIEIRAASAVIIEGGGLEKLGNVSSAAYGSGEAGKVFIKAPEIKVRQQGNIESTTEGAGKGGAIEIEADNSLLLESGGEITSGSKASGEGGKVAVQSSRIHIANGARISTQSTGSGNAGMVNVHNTDVLHLESGGEITSGSQAAGTGGNVAIQA
ncbi:MAG: filamentous hemagglutinin N-terminal domain-containing protein, partial [Gammaproteobacteria bacterium]|nr:filamentous hemagglutinin N-terminal domain-containing protein [Gammaproteobacteria bacterium]